MRFIRPSFEIWEQGLSKEDMLKHVERCGRICYASADRSTDGSYKEFVDMTRKNGHLSVMEHGTVYMTYSFPYCDSAREILERYETNPYSKVEWSVNGNNNMTLDVTTNLRVMEENGWKIENICEPTALHHKRVTVCVTCDRAIANEIVRHRRFSYSQQSTRYCDYSKDRFGNELSFVIPDIYQNDLFEGEYRQDGFGFLGTSNDGTKATYIDHSARNGLYLWTETMHNAEDKYIKLIQRYKIKPEHARDILPLSLATKLVMTGFVEDWEHFLELRTSRHAHPQMREIAIPLMDEFIKRGYILDGSDKETNHGVNNVK